MAASTPKEPVTAEAPQEVVKVITVINKEEYEKVLGDAGNKVVVIEFYASWCGSCKSISQKLDEVANIFKHKAVIIKMDVDECEEIAIEYNVQSIPTFIFLQNKNKLYEFMGSKIEKVISSMTKFCGEPENGQSRQSMSKAPETNATTTATAKKE